MTNQPRRWQDRSRYQGDGTMKKGRELPRADYQRRAENLTELFKRRLREMMRRPPESQP